MIIEIGPNMGAFLAASIAAIVVLVPLMMKARADKKDTDVKLDDIHTLVNSRLTQVLDENSEFKRIITALLDAKNRTVEEQSATKAVAAEKLITSGTK